MYVLLSSCMVIKIIKWKPSETGPGGLELVEWAELGTPAQASQDTPGGHAHPPLVDVGVVTRWLGLGGRGGARQAGWGESKGVSDGRVNRFWAEGAVVGENASPVRMRNEFLIELIFY